MTETTIIKIDLPKGMGPNDNRDDLGFMEKLVALEASQRRQHDNRGTEQ